MIDKIVEFKKRIKQIQIQDLNQENYEKLVDTWFKILFKEDNNEKNS
tara:strand:- start:1138 stop:1278 length:141 start_codon:yes stop_codon:yes gene_type:complete